MTLADRPAFAKLLAWLQEGLGGEVSEAKAEVYFTVLKDLELTALEAGAIEHARTNKFFPKPVELRDLADPGWRQREESARARAMMLSWVQQDKQQLPS